MSHPYRLSLGFLFGIALGLLPGLATARTPVVAAGSAWCEEDDDNSIERPTAFVIHELSLGARRAVAVDAGQNGGVQVETWDGDEVQLCAVVRAEASTQAAADRLANAVRIETSGTVSPQAPRLGRHEGLSVSFRLRVPRQTDLDLAAHNGGVAIDGVHGRLRAETTNGGLMLEDVGGDVRVRTVNGGLHIVLSGDRWEGAGLDAETTNGGVHLSLPDRYAASLETSTVNGGFNLDYPVATREDDRGRLILPLGGGGAPVRVVTTNGGVHVDRN